METRDFSEVICTHCKQRVPVTQAGKVARHYGTFKKQPISARDRGGKVKVLCNGSDQAVQR